MKRPRTDNFPKHDKFHLSQPHAGWVRQWATEDRRTFSEIIRIAIEHEAEFRAKLPHPNGNGKHEACN